MRTYEWLEQEVRALMGVISISEIMGNPKLVERFKAALRELAKSREQKTCSPGLRHEIRGLIEAISTGERTANPVVREYIDGIGRRLGV